MQVIGDLAVAIQAGGESKRMGTSKALVPFLGKPLIMQAFERLYPICSEMVITTNEPEKMGFMEPYIASGKLRLISDDTDKRGALIGVHTALQAVTKPFMSMVACDMVFPSPELIARLREVLVSTGADVAMPIGSKGIEPFHAVFRRETCLDAVEKALEAGDMRAVRWTDNVNRIDVDVSELDAEGIRVNPFVNVNTMPELRELEAWLASNR